MSSSILKGDRSRAGTQAASEAGSRMTAAMHGIPIIVAMDAALAGRAHCRSRNRGIDRGESFAMLFKCLQATKSTTGNKNALNPRDRDSHVFPIESGVIHAVLVPMQNSTI